MLFDFTKSATLTTDSSRRAHARERKHVAAALSDYPWHELKVCMLVMVIAGEDNGKVKGTSSHAMPARCKLTVPVKISLVGLHCSSGLVVGLGPSGPRRPRHRTGTRMLWREAVWADWAVWHHALRHFNQPRPQKNSI